MKDTFKYFELSKMLARNLSGKGDDKDVVELGKWLAESDANKKLFERLKKKQANQNWENVLSEIDVEQKWLQLEGSIVPPRKRSITFQLLKYAAVLAIAVLPGYWMLHDHNKTEEVVIAVNTPSQPVDSTEVILQLATGEKINLCAENSSTLLEDEQVSISVKEGKKLEYTPKQEKGKEIKYNHLFVPHGRTINIVLSDGTEVWLNAGSEFTYPEVFTTETREVKLDGEGFFKVAENKQKPFEIKTTELTYRVLGTSFNINCFRDNKKVEAVLVDGSLGIYKANARFSENTVVKIKPNEKAAFDPAEGNMNIKNVDTDLYTSWRDGKFTFRNETFEEIAFRLERSYDVEIQCNYPELLNERYIGKFDNESIEDILNSFRINRNFEYKSSGKKITIQKMVE